MKSIYIVIIVLLFISIFSCSSDYGVLILGKWKSIDDKETIEFYKDGTMVNEKFGEKLTGNYNFVNKNQIQIILKEKGKFTTNIICVFSVSKNELSLTLPDKSINKYRRVR